MTTTDLTVNESDLIDAMHKVEVIADTTSHWSAVRIDPDGTIRVSEEPSRCYSENEYYKRFPHTVTVYQKNGNGQCSLNEDEIANPSDVMLEYYRDELKRVEEVLVEAGYEVEME